MEQVLGNFRQGVRGYARRIGLPAFWQWWMGELAQVVPAASRTAVQRRLVQPVLAFERGAAVLMVPRAKDGSLVFVESARIPLTGDAAEIERAGRAALDLARRELNGAVSAEFKVVIALPAAQTLRKKIMLPAAVEPELRQALAFDLDRHTPFRAEDVYFDAVICGRDPETKQIEVDWAAAQKSHVDPARRQAESWGTKVVGVTPAGIREIAAGTLSRLNLLPQTERTLLPLWKRWQLWVPLLAVVVAATAAVVVPVWQKRSLAIAINWQMDQARKEAQGADALRGELEQKIDEYNYVLARKYAYPSTIQVLEDISKTLPDDTWLTQLEIKTFPRKPDIRRELNMRGESNNAGALVSVLETTGIVTDVAPRSPTTKIQPPPGEVFDLGAVMKPLPAPAPVQLDTADAGSPPTIAGTRP